MEREGGADMKSSRATVEEKEVEYDKEGKKERKERKTMTFTE